ncbi:hypothetical protein [Saliphagus infecundisoli]|uniref:Tetrapyrrole biosynthesis glutamyl-tRNA reductase dimerisation domain-containing protein n=1 Tax=Saliphagus infecundisoli TaxID=1849069 RepID=A0ABD5QL26_9EURY|nr:hypothetical protein [Saliphagus infecundisoli]
MSVSDQDDLDPEAVQSALRAYGDEIKRKEIQRMFNRLEANQEFTCEQREIIRQMATAIVEGVLTAPELEDNQRYDDEDVQTIVSLFDLDQ